MNHLLENEVNKLAITNGEPAECWTIPIRAIHLVRAELTSDRTDARERLGRARIKGHVTAMNTNDNSTGDECLVVFNLQAHNRNDRTLPVFETSETHALDLPTGPMINHYEMVFTVDGLEFASGETLLITLVSMK